MNCGMNDIAYTFRPSIASPPDANDLMKAPFNIVCSSHSISLLLIVLAFFSPTTQHKALAGSGFPNLLKIKPLAFNSVPLPELLPCFYRLNAFRAHAFAPRQSLHIRFFD